MNYEERYSDAELVRILEQALIYMCACPAQLAKALQQTRALCRYQSHCIATLETEYLAHQEIARGAIKAHEELQTCMDRVIAIEGWNRSTLEMPEGLRKRQLDEINDDLR